MIKVIMKWYEILIKEIYSIAMIHKRKQITIRLSSHIVTQIMRFDIFLKHLDDCEVHRQASLRY